MKQVSPGADNSAMTFDKFHSIMGHPKNAVLKETAKSHNIQLTDVHHRPYQHCAKAKFRMKNTPKENDNIATKRGEGLLINIFWIRTATYADDRNWLLVMDEYTNYLLPFLSKTNYETKPTQENRGIQQEIIQIPKIGIQFEFTVPDTPQQNDENKLKFVTLYGNSAQP
jgi:hypothetical protein